MRFYNSRKFFYKVEHTIQERQLFSLSDKLLVGVSGGKDSLALTECLVQLGYSIETIHILIEPDHTISFGEFCRERSEFTLIKTDILAQALNSKRNNVCYICTRLRRKALSEYATENGFTKLVFAHHRDDAVETLLLNLLFQREISTMMPRQSLFNGKLDIVRPFYDITEKEISRFAKQKQLPISNWRCGVEKDSRRNWVREQLKDWQKSYPNLRIKENIFAAIQNVNAEFLPDRIQSADTISMKRLNKKEVR